jgi:hypothetical protein
MKLIQGHYHNKNLPTEVPRDKVFTLGMITMQTIQELQEFEVEASIYRSGKIH